MVKSTTDKIEQKTQTNTLSRIVELSLLYDFYGALLKEHKRQIFEDYILNDYSLSEIANEQGMSRQGVHDTVKRCSKELAHYEETLHLIDKFHKTKEEINEINKIAKEIRIAKNIDRIDEIEELSKRIVEQL